MSPILGTVILLTISNSFMTLAWYGHLKFKSSPLWMAIGVSWLIALLEYIFQVPANRLGFGTLSAYQLKILQESITLLVFMIFALFYFGESLTWRYGISFSLIFLAVIIAFYKP
jgi:uncharacterized protein